MKPGPVIQQRRVESQADELPPGLHPVMRRILLARGVRNPQGLELGLNSLHTPETLGGIQTAANLMAQAVSDHQHILIVGDFDADGATGTALAIRALKAMGAEHVSFKVPNRFEFGYGLTPGLVETLAEQPPDLLVTVDSGINCIAGVKKATKLGCTVIVTDHHLPGTALPVADAIVNPNLPGDRFPSKALAGVGVMFYLLSSVRGVLRQQGWFKGKNIEPNLASFLDLVALGTVADLVPLDHNNRILVSQGLARIRAGQGCPGIMALLRAGNRDYRHLVAADLGFAVAPRLNAAGRLEDMSVGIRCLLSDDRIEAAELAQLLDELNSSRKSMQQQMQDEAGDKLELLIKNLQGQTLPFSMCLHDPSWHQGIVGLVASRIKDRIHRPTVVFAPEQQGMEVLKGSARSIPGLHIRDVLAHVDGLQPGMITAFGGHAMAAGLTLPARHLEQFRAALEHSVELFLEGTAPSEVLLTDGQLPGQALDLEFAQEIRDHGPWGQRFPEPLFEGSFEIISHRVVGGAHLKMVVRPLDGNQPVDAIAFGRLPEHLPDSGAVNLLYRLDVNHFRGERTCQLIVERII